MRQRVGFVIRVWRAKHPMLVDESHVEAFLLDAQLLAQHRVDQVHLKPLRVRQVHSGLAAIALAFPERVILGSDHLEANLIEQLAFQRGRRGEVVALDRGRFQLLHGHAMLAHGRGQHAFRVLALATHAARGKFQQLAQPPHHFRVGAHSCTSPAARRADTPRYGASSSTGVARTFFTAAMHFSTVGSPASKSDKL